MASTTINISIDEDLLKELDDEAKIEYSSRSDYIRQSVLDRIYRRRALRKGKSEVDKAWEELLAASDEIDRGLTANGIITDEDIVKAVKEIRREG